MSFVPRVVDEIDPPWLTEALQARHPGARVEAVEVTERAEVTNSHAWLAVRYAATSAPGPERLFCKLLPGEKGRREAIAATAMGLREAKFYDGLAARLALRVPAAHVVRLQSMSSV